MMIFKTKEARFLTQQLKNLELLKRWEDVFFQFLFFRRMIILSNLQMKQIINIAKLDIDEVYKIAHDVQDPTITLTDLEKLAIDFHLA